MNNNIPLKTRTRVVSLRISEEIYKLVWLEALRQNIPPSRLLTKLVSSAAQNLTPPTL